MSSVKELPVSIILHSIYNVVMMSKRTDPWLSYGLMRAIKEKTTRNGNLLATPLFLEIYPNECKGKYQITDKLLSGGFRPSNREWVGGGRGPKKIFSQPFAPQFGLKIRGVAPRPTNLQLCCSFDRAGLNFPNLHPVPLSVTAAAVLLSSHTYVKVRSLPIPNSAVWSLVPLFVFPALYTCWIVRFPRAPQDLAGF